jgi:hypothetical protein
MEVTLAVRHIGQVVTDVLSGDGDPDGDARLSGRNPEPVTRCPRALITGLSAERDTDRLSDPGVHMGRSYRIIGPARWSMLRVVVDQRPTLDF